MMLPCVCRSADPDCRCEDDYLDWLSDTRIMGFGDALTDFEVGNDVDA